VDPIDGLYGFSLPSKLILLTRPSRIVSVALAIALASSATPAIAQVPPPPPPPPAPPAAPAAPQPSAAASNAAADLAAGDKAAKAKDWSGALTHYQAVLQAGPNPRAQLGAADALYQLGRAGEAYDAYDEMQRTVGPKVGPADKALVTARLKDLTNKTGALSVRVAEPGAAVDVDGKSLGTSPLAAIVRVATGPHDVHVTKDGFVPFIGHADVGPDGRASIDAALVRQATQGHLVVRAPGSEPLRVLVDGVDLGVTPWEGDVAAGAHDVTGRSSNASATPQTVNVTAGERASVDLVTAATAAHLQVRTSDGKGLVYLDGVVKGEGAFAGDVSPGPHTVVVTRDGYDRFEKTLTLAQRDTWAETVTLKPVAATGGEVAAAERPIEGVYGGLGIGPMFGVGGQGTDLETGCSTLGASSCDTPEPLGGVLFGYVGWTWNPVGFELMLGGGADTVQQTAHFDGNAGPNAPPSANPPRDEKFTYVRFGGLVAVRARATFQGRLWRGTVAGGLGASYRGMVMKRDTTATDGRTESYAPQSLVSYLSPALSVEGAFQFRVAPTFALALGLEMLADNAPASASVPSDLSQKHQLSPQTNQPAPIPTPAYHLASGPQVFIGPFLGIQFGP
jgi:hypothetical protein